MVSVEAVARGSFALVPFLFVLAGLAWRKRDETAAVAVTVYHLLLAAAASVNGAVLLIPDPETKFFLTGAALVFMGTFVIAWVAVALAYTGYEDWLGRRVLAALAVEPAALVVATVVPPLRPFVVSVPETGGVGHLTDLGTEAGLLMIVHFVYLFVLMLVATGLFLNLFLRSRYLNRGQAVALIGAATVPWVTVLAQTFEVTSTDLSVFTWTLAGAAITVGLYRIDILDPVPVGRSAAIEEMGDAVLVLDEDECIADSNPAAAEFLGFDPGAAHGEPVAAVLPDFDRIRSDDREWAELAVEEGGKRRYLEAQVEPFTDHLDRQVGRLVVARDVTDRKHREQTLARYKTVFETVEDRVYVLDSEGRFLLVNEPLAALLDRDREELIGEPFDSVLVADAEFDPLAADTTDGPVEIGIRTDDGEVLPVETEISPIEFEDVRGIVGYVRDISRRKEAERSLEETSGRLDTLVGASPLAVVGTDPEGNVRTWNPAAEEMFGYTEAEAVGDPPRIIPEDSRDRVLERFERVLAGERFRDMETKLECKDGSVIDASISLAPQYGPSKEVRGMVSVIADVTERKERERRLQRQNERLDQFASIVSHDLRNPLNVASGRLELLREEADSDHIEPIEDALDRMETLIEETLTLAREGQTVAELETVSLEPVVRQCWDSIEPDGGDVSLVVDPLQTVEADPNRLRQIFENLFRNAVEHGLREGEPLTIRVGPLDAGGFYVEDDGAGISEDPEEIFQPGTTSDPGGTGFGLAIVRRIVGAHGWEITATESETGGARFEVTGVDSVRPVTPEDRL